MWWKRRIRALLDENPTELRIVQYGLDEFAVAIRGAQIQGSEIGKKGFIHQLGIYAEKVVRR